MRTLKNAVDQNNVHHAYMFVGSRGTGKTSMAKILASALNAEGGPSSSFSADDPAARAIATGSSLDVVEMDAASHNGVDDIRALIESVALAPTTGGWKVYILDEAHMITTQGWNAFLKTLEEPPSNTVFVLATTEANKILPTVADRCHRFDFRRPTVEQLSEALRRAAGAEGINIGDDAVAMIARSATGSFRDALGTLEQLVTYGGEDVKAEDVQAVLGVADFDLLATTCDAIAAGDRRGVLIAVGELADRGRDMAAFARDLAGHVRNLLIARTLGEAPAAAGLTAEQSQRLVEQAAQFTPERTAHTLDLISTMLQQASAGGEPRLLLELALFKAARPADDSDPGALLARIEALESQPAGGPPAPAPPARPVPPAAAAGSEDPAPENPPEGGAPTSGERTAAAAESVESMGNPAPTSGERTKPTAGAEESVPDVASTSGERIAVVPGDEGPGAGESAGGSTEDVAPTRGERTEPLVQGVESAPDSAPTRGERREPVVQGVESVADVALTSGGRDGGVVGEGSIDVVEGAWDLVVGTLLEESPSLASALENSQPLRIEERFLVVAVPESASFQRKQIEQPGKRELITEHIRRATGFELQVRAETLPDSAFIGDETGVGIDPDELIASLKEEFDATEITPPPEQAPGTA